MISLIMVFIWILGFFSETRGACPNWILLKFKNRGIQKGKRELKKQKGNKEDKPS
jgi:hypothetical protein